MPLYDYRCEACDVVFESSRRIAEMLAPESEPCPSCGELKVKRAIITAPGLADPVRLGLQKPDSGFREVLHKIHEKMPGSRLKDNSTYF